MNRSAFLAFSFWQVFLARPKSKRLAASRSTLIASLTTELRRRGPRATRCRCSAARNVTMRGILLCSSDIRSLTSWTPEPRWEYIVTHQQWNIQRNQYKQTYKSTKQSTKQSHRKARPTNGATDHTFIHTTNCIRWIGTPPYSNIQVEAREYGNNTTCLVPQHEPKLNLRSQS